MDKPLIVTGIKKGEYLEFSDVHLFLVPNCKYSLHCYKVTIHLETNLVQCFDFVFKDRLPRVTFYYLLETKNDA